MHAARRASVLVANGGHAMGELGKCDGSQEQPHDPFTAEILAAQRGCSHALGRLFQQYHAYLLYIANRRIPVRMRAKSAPSSIVQETLLQLSSKFDRFSGTTEGEFKAWMRGALLNNIADRDRRFAGTQKRDISREIPLDHEAASVQSLHDERQAAPLERAQAADEASQLHAALMRLTERHRQVILMRNFEELPFAEIGQILNCTSDAARKLWARAVSRLKDELTDNPGQPEDCHG